MEYQIRTEEYVERYNPGHSGGHEHSEEDPYEEACAPPPTGTSTSRGLLPIEPGGSPGPGKDDPKG